MSTAPRALSSTSTTSASTPSRRAAVGRGSATVAEAAMKRGRRPVQGGHPAQPSQDQCHVRAEDAPVGVRLVDDDELQAAQERPPGLVSGQDPAVEHVRVGHDPPGVRPGPRPLLVGGVPVDGGCTQTGQAQGAEPGELVVGQGLGRAQVQDRRVRGARRPRARRGPRSAPASRRRRTCPRPSRSRRARAGRTRPGRRCGPGGATAGRSRAPRRRAGRPGAARSASPRCAPPAPGG